jgi:hypothetical protein
MNSIGRHPLSVLWVYLATRETAGEENAKLLAVCAAKAHQADTNERQRRAAEDDKKKRRGKKNPRTVQNARVSGDVVRIGGYDLELCRSGNRESRGQRVAQRGPVVGTLDEFAAAWRAVDAATNGQAQAVCEAIERLNAGEPAHDRFFDSSAYTRALDVVGDGAHRAFPEALIKLGRSKAA